MVFDPGPSKVWQHAGSGGGEGKVRFSQRDKCVMVYSVYMCVTFYRVCFFFLSVASGVYAVGYLMRTR